MLLVFVRGHSHSAYNHDTNGLGNNYDWQSLALDDNTKINLVSYPGTHDTMADDNDGDAVGMNCSQISLKDYLIQNKYMHIHIPRLSGIDINKAIRSRCSCIRYSL